MVVVSGYPKSVLFVLLRDEDSFGGQRLYFCGAYRKIEVSTEIGSCASTR